MIPPLTFFSLPRAFENKFDYIQYNAIKSWRINFPNSEIILFGDEKGTHEMCRKVNAQHYAEIQLNNFGTPFIHSIFGDAQRLATADTLCYINTDVILLHNLENITTLAKQEFKEFLLVACRWELNLKEKLNFNKDWKAVLQNELSKHSQPPWPLYSGIDCFIFSKNLFPIERFPTFLLGREVWDAWVITDVIHRKIPVINISEEITIIHQTHTRPEDSLDPQQVRTELSHNSKLFYSHYKKQLTIPNVSLVFQKGKFEKRLPL